MKSIYSLGERELNRLAFSGTYPTIFLISNGSLLTSISFNKTFPLSNPSTPVRIFTVVDLPAPFVPM